jgi:hypothetical protein
MLEPQDHVSSRRPPMNREAELSKLTMVEEQLLNAHSSLLTASHRLGESGELSDQIAGTLGALEEAIALAARAKRKMRYEWRMSLTQPIAA